MPRRRPRHVVHHAEHSEQVLAVRAPYPHHRRHPLLPSGQRGGSHRPGEALFLPYRGCSCAPQGADVNCLHGTLKPLHCACMVADADCVELLLQKGAEVNALDGYNRTALHYAAEKDETCVEILLEYGANPNALDGNKDTPLHWAAFKNNAECVRALLANGALVNALDYNNDTPLSWAAMKGNLESVSVLLDFGAEVRVVNLKGQSPISRLVALLVRGLGTEREDSCLDLLHRATGHFELRKNGSLPWEVARDPQLCQRLTLLCSAPGTLQALSRYAVRRSLGLRFLPQAVQQLPLPACLKEYLLLLT
ncbi:ankyrin repeat and SOCS box protein 8 isoform X2 [Zonotrichia albicollis]|uniref:ankyrin repeat and SOCS box protein 8 isoform X2 n=1 Tax=Zonotrichia albicollis TaxID=44394 RepID=UPI003D8125AA